MAASGLVDDEVIELKLNGSARGEVSGALVRRAIEYHIAQKREDLLPWLLTHPALTEGVMTELLDSNPALLCELGHQPGPPKLLNFLAEKYRYPEAVLTVAKNLYTNPDVPTADFQAFLARHADNEWMLKSLAHLSPSTEKKEKELIAVLKNHTTAYDYFISVQRSLQRHKRAREATSEETMRELFQTGDPAALRGLVLNPLTPEPILRELARGQGIKGAREIRELANQALRRFSKNS
jgi:hypothetical protein